MADRSLSLAAFFARRRKGSDGLDPNLDAPRPAGVVIWVRALQADQVNALKGLEDQLRADGDDITLLVTFPEPAGPYGRTPQGRAEVGVFLAHWKPELVLWLEADLDPASFFELAQRKTPCMLISATQQALRASSTTWVPGVGRAMFKQCVSIMTVDDDVRELFLRSGVDPKKVQTLGQLESAPTPLPHFEDERQDLAKSLGARSVWLAADTSLAEIDQIANAHHMACRRAHRLLLIVALKNPADAALSVEKLEMAGFDVALRTSGEEPTESTQVYVADTEDELGLWYRIAPITYLGGSLIGGPCRDPFEPATLGSAVLHGPDVSPFEQEIARLAVANACVSLSSFEELGQSVERLLSPDKTAQIVHAAWDVTSRSADVSNRLAEAIIAELDRSGA